MFEAFRSIGIADDRAILASQALGKRDSDITRLTQDMSSVKTDVAGLEQDVAVLKTEAALLKSMVGVVMAMSLTILFKVFHG